MSFQCRDLLDRCLTSVREHGGGDGAMPEIWVVDNASTDGTLEMLAARHPAAHVISADRNLGFAAANNLALREVDTEYVLMLNPDTELHAGTLAGLIPILDERPGVGMAGCRLVRPDGRFDHAARRSFPTIAGALGHFSGLGRRARSPVRLAQYRAPERENAGPVDAINGALMLIRRAALEDVGPFDPGYWLYMEDLDLCYRFKQHGWEVFYEPRVTATHVKGATSGRHRRWRQNRAFHYGMYRFYRKFYAPERPPLLNLVVYVGIVVKLAVSALGSVLGRARTRVSTPG